MHAHTSWQDAQAVRDDEEGSATVSTSTGKWPVPIYVHT